MKNSVRSSNEPNKDDRHKFMREYDTERRERAKRLFHWSLDMPPDDDDVDVRVNKHQGFGWKELAVIAAAILGGAYLFTGHQNPAVPQTLPQTSPQDSEYDVRFYDREGNLIDIPRKQ